MEAHHTRNAVRESAVALVLSALLIASLASACAATEERERLDVAADYVRCSVDGDYEAMSEVVAEEARPYCYALASAPKPEEKVVAIVDETWDEDSLIFEIEYGPASTFLRLAPPKEESPDDVLVETWNKAGARSAGTLTVDDEDGELVVTHVDGEPIEDVLAVGSGGL